MDIFEPLLVLLMIAALLVLLTIKLHKLMIGNKIKFLENNKLTFGLITYLRELHQSNIEDAEEQELMNAE